jgi:hypothetical protein
MYQGNWQTSSLYLYVAVGDMHLVTWKVSDHGLVVLALGAASMTVHVIRQWNCLFQTNVFS